MTTTTHTVAAMLVAAVAQLNTLNLTAKKQGAPLFSLSTDIGNGVTFRELKAWAKEQTAKTSPVKASPKADPKPAADEGRKFPVRSIDVTGSSNLKSCEYDRNTKTLTVTFQKTGAVYAYADVSLKEARALEEAPSKGIHLNAEIKPVKTVTLLDSGKGGAIPKEDKKAPVTEAATVNTTDLREKGFYAGRKHDTVHKIVRNKETDEREVIGASGNRYPLASVQLVKGKYRVAEVAETAPVKTETKPAPKAETAPVAEFTRKDLIGAEMVVGRKAEVIEKTVMRDGVRHIVTASGAAFAVTAIRKNNRGRFTLNETAEKAPVKAAPVKASPKAETAPVKHTGRAATRNDVLNQEVRVVKGSKDNVFLIKRVVRRNDVPCAITKNGGALPLAQIAVLDGQPTFTGKLTMDEYRAL